MQFIMKTIAPAGMQGGDRIGAASGANAREIFSVDTVQFIKKQTIRPARLEDVSAIVKIHLAAFPHFFLSTLGGSFLRAYYSFVLRYDLHLFFVVENGGQVVGFVAGSVNPVRFYRQMASQAWRFVFPILGGLFWHPLLLPKIFYNIWKIISLKKTPPAESRYVCELASLAVHPDHVGKGFGKDLVRKFVEVTEPFHIRQIRLQTDARNNDAANLFYQRLGFRLYRTFLAYNTRAMNEYVLDVGDRGNAFRQRVSKMV
jgi:ribosomal protein S18 acetylase RimI-like enzyme